VSLTDRLTRLSDVLVALSGSPIPTHLFQTLADLAPAAVPCDYLAVCLPIPEQPGYLVHSLGPLPADISARAWKPDEGIPGRIMRTGYVALVADLVTDDDAGPLEDIFGQAGLRAILGVPVRRGIEVIGALLFASRSPGAYSPDDAQIAGLIAAGLGSALEGARAYQALADERSTLAAVLGSTSDAVIMLNDEGVVLLANPAVGPMLGLVPDAMVGRSLLEVPGHEPLRHLFEESRARTVELPLPDGRTAQASLISVVTPYGEPVGLAAVLRDITLLKHLDRMKTDFVNTVSHDLKNPISVIEGTAEIISWKAKDDPALQRRVLRIRDEARYMAELVSDLLDLGKIEAGLGPPMERVDAVQLVAKAVQKMAATAEAKGVVIDTELPGETWVTAAPPRLTQVLLNLVGNAVKYTPDGGRVTVSVSTRGDAGRSAGTVVLSVKDTGIGIAPLHLPRVFEKFYRIHDATTKDIPGTGLGLAIAKSIVESHGGRITVESTVGVGSTFLVELPECPPSE
jgi:two-component system, OmpR family, phosphate regulon sensor histidine kinase PhoR